MQQTSIASAYRKSWTGLLTNLRDCVDLEPDMILENIG